MKSAAVLGGEAVNRGAVFNIILVILNPAQALLTNILGTFINIKFTGYGKNRPDKSISGVQRGKKPIRQ